MHCYWLPNRTHIARSSSYWFLQYFTDCKWLASWSLLNDICFWVTQLRNDRRDRVQLPPRCLFCCYSHLAMCLDRTGPDFVITNIRPASIRTQSVPSQLSGEFLFSVDGKVFVFNFLLTCSFQTISRQNGSEGRRTGLNQLIDDFNISEREWARNFHWEGWN